MMRVDPSVEKRVMYDAPPAYMPASMRRDQGFGLIELMISMAIASFLLLGLVTMAGSMQNSYTTQSNSASIHDKERFASSLFSALLQSGGYYSVTYSSANTSVPDISTYLPIVVTNNAPGAQYGLRQFVAGSGAAGGNGPDVLNVRYMDGGTDTAGYNCLGKGTSGAGIYESVISVDTAHKTLICQVGFNGAAPTGATGASTVLLDGVTNMQVSYNVTHSADIRSPLTLQYYRSIDMTAADWGSVRSVQITLTFQDPVTPLVPNPPTYTFTQTYQVMYESP